MDELLKIIILGIVQGITEFLPISSNAHLIIMEQLLNFQNNNEILNLVFHLGSLFAIISYFFSELLGLLKKPKIILNLIIATLPVVIIGYFVFKFRLIDYGNFPIKIIAITTIIFGIILFFSDKIKITKKLYTDLNAKNSFSNWIISGDSFNSWSEQIWNYINSRTFSWIFKTRCCKVFFFFINTHYSWSLFSWDLRFNKNG